MPSLAELPIEILQENLIPFLDARGLLHLTCTSKVNVQCCMPQERRLIHHIQFFSVVCSDDAVWKQKLVADFNFTGAGTARTTGWKVIYRGLHKPKGKSTSHVCLDERLMLKELSVYVWGYDSFLHSP